MEIMPEVIEEVPKDTGEYTEASYYQLDGKFGFVYPKGNPHPNIYDGLFRGNGAFIVWQDEKYGLVDMLGVPITKLEYDSIGALHSSFVVKKGGKYGTMSAEAKTILPIEFNAVLGANKDLTFVEDSQNRVRMVFNANGELFPEPIEYAELYGNLAFLKSNGKFGVVTNEVILPFEYDSLSYAISKSPDAVRQGRKNNPFVFERRNLSQNLSDFIVHKDGKLGLYDSAGKEIYPVENDGIFRENAFKYYKIVKGKTYGIYFPKSKKSTPIEYQNVYADGYGFVMAVKDNKAGVYSLDGEVLVPFEYDNEFVMQLRDVGFRVRKDGKRGIVSEIGEVLIPTIYDDVSSLYDGQFRQFFEVKLNGKFGVVNTKGEVIVPVRYDWVGTEGDLFKVTTEDPDRKFGLIDKTGKVLVPVEYRWITDSPTRESTVTILVKDSVSMNFLNKRMERILAEDVAEYGYVLNEALLLNPFNYANQFLLYVKSKKGKYGLLNELNGTLDVPMEYDEIIQRFNSQNHSYYAVRKGKKYGLIDEKNNVILPIKFKDIDVNLVPIDFENESEDNYQVVVKKGKKYGTVNLKNEVVIPFEYEGLSRNSIKGFFKAKVDGSYVVIDSNNQRISEEFFDEVSKFEETPDRNLSYTTSHEVMTFKDGEMRMMNSEGKFTTSPVEMEMHDGYKTFEELKEELIVAFNSPDDKKLKEVAKKMAPSKHLMCYLKKNIFDGSRLYPIEEQYVQDKYFEILQKFKWSYWNSDFYNRSSLTKVTDFTLYKDGIITNSRTEDHAYGDTKYLEKVLRNAMKVNGYWISTYFMKRYFN